MGRMIENHMGPVEGLPDACGAEEAIWALLLWRMDWVVLDLVARVSGEGIFETMVGMVCGFRVLADCSIL